MAVSRPGGHKLGRRRWWQPGGLVAKSDTAVLALDALHGARAPGVQERAVAAGAGAGRVVAERDAGSCLLYTSPSPRDMRRSRMPSSA